MARIATFCLLLIFPLVLPTTTDSGTTQADNDVSGDKFSNRSLGLLTGGLITDSAVINAAGGIISAGIHGVVSLGELFLTGPLSVFPPVTGALERDSSGRALNPIVRSIVELRQPSAPRILEHAIAIFQGYDNGEPCYKVLGHVIALVFTFFSAIVKLLAAGYR